MSDLKKVDNKDQAVVNVLDSPDYHSDEKHDFDAPRRGDVHQRAIESDLVVLSQDVDAVYDRAILLSTEEVVEILESAWLEHHDDPNFPAAVRAKIEYFLSGDASTLENYDLLLEEMKIEAALIRFSSPYPEVRAVVNCVDDFDMPASTFRVWLMGTFWCGLGTFINQFFSIRQPSFSLTVNEVQLLSYPLGLFLAKVLPTKRFPLFGYSATLNPGPFNEKEHMLLTIMANVGMFAPYTMNVLIVQQLPIFYDQPWSADFGYQILTGLSIQLIGMGFAGMVRRFIVYPEHCIWLLNLATIALNKSFHDTRNVVANGWKISRMKFFLIAFGAMFVYFWFPGGLFEAMSYFNWITWIAPNSVIVMAIFGQISGLGFNPIPTLDWNIFHGSTVMVLPFFSTFNQFIGTFLAAPIILGFWYGNVWDTGYFPLNSNRIFDNTGARYNVSKILTPEKQLDHAKYSAYSKPYMAASNLVLYGAFFALYTATIAHTILYHRKEIVNGFKVAYKSIRAGEKGTASFKDYHSQAMSKYAEVPEWAYLILTVFAVVIGCIALTVYPTNSSVSCIFFGIFLCIILVIPLGIITAITGVQVTLNVFAEFIGGVIYPENALAMNYFKSYGVMTTMNALAFAQDLKLAHYLKIGQRYTFAVQVYGAVIACFVSTAILNYQMTIPEVCQVQQPDHFICNGENTFFTATVFWGTLGPKRVFGAGGIYTGLMYCFLMGAVAPIPFYFMAKKWPTSLIAKTHVPVIIYVSALTYGPYSTMANVWPGVVVAYVFQVYIKKRYLPWWSKYNYILATAFGAAIPLCGIFLFCALFNTGLQPVWWGNSISYDGCDASGCRRLEIPESGFVGEAPGSGAWD
ncbi:OPT-domain-containing protein [Mrakia frigida]|uniref:OPT-domain-containing protein n=1 Tax=Mrakia frigida TaxID=29902 RepID=UPI003FCBF395